MAYITDWRFWLAVIVVSFVTHWVIGKFLGGSSGGTSA